MDEERSADDARAREREEAALRWLGGAGADGGRLARIFQIDADARVSELESQLAELREKLLALELELAQVRLHAQPVETVPSEPVGAAVVDPRRAQEPSERDYRLRRCEQFTVYAGTRPVGVVEGVRYGSRTDRPDVLEIRGGGIRSQVLLVSIDDVEAIDPAEEAVILDEAWSPHRSTSVSDALHLLVRLLPGRTVDD